MEHASGTARVIRCEEDVTFLIEDLFRETFGDPPPRDPVHYLAFVKTGPSAFDLAGYYHVAHSAEFALVGGLCVSPRHRRRGIGEALERTAFEFPGTAKAFFAYVGDPKRASHVGFGPTPFPHLMVRWLRDATDEEKERLVHTVAQLGPF